MSSLSYKDAGVDIDRGNLFVNRISDLVKSTYRREVISDIGPFSAFFKIDLTRYKEPVLVSGTDGVGTKLKIAFMTDIHNSVGIDLVAMCVNDILTSGAEPLFFLDYFASSTLDVTVGEQVIEGIANGCKQAGCSLIGGETAEMPDFYAAGEYDLSGFVVGIVNKSEIIDGSLVNDGDGVIGIASSGLHSNGYSLARKLFFDILNFNPDSFISEFNKTIGQELLTPTTIYKNAFFSIRDKIEIHGMAHITGGGLLENIPRILPNGLGVKLNLNSWDIPPVFTFIKERGNVSDEEMFRTFNMGIGYVIIVPGDSTDDAVKLLLNCGYSAYIAGSVVKGTGVQVI